MNDAGLRRFSLPILHRPGSHRADSMTAFRPGLAARRVRAFEKAEEGAAGAAGEEGRSPWLILRLAFFLFIYAA